MKKKDNNILKSKGNTLKIIRISISFILFIVGLVLEKTVPVENKLIWLAIQLPAYLIIGYDVLWKAFKNILHGKVFDENFLMTIASIGAFAIGTYPEGVAVMVFYQLGELFQTIAVNKSRKSISGLMDIRPDYANLKEGDGEVKVDPFDVKVGDLIVIKPGEKIPLDAIVIEGKSSLNTTALTGESMPREVQIGSEILSGSINNNGVIIAKVTKEFSESTASKILDLVENASNNKSTSENFITKFAKYYTPSVVIVALLLAIIPPIFVGNWSNWIYRALTFLVVSCPCALVISIPLSFFGGIGNASKKGVLIKGSNYLEALNNTEIVVFDKTGTLTKGVFKVQKINAIAINKNELLDIAAHAESYSLHPISKSIIDAYGKKIDKKRLGEIEEIAGFGVKVFVDNKEVLIGNAKLMEKFNIPFKEDKEQFGTISHIAINGKYAGNFVISDEVKKDSKKAIEMLKASGVKKVVMLTGDNKNIGEKVANSIGIDEVYSELLPIDKVDKVENLLKEKSPKGKLVFVGDGINDAPVLARSDVGIAMGGVGSDAAIEASDVVLMTDEPSKISETIKISKKTSKIVKQNIYFVLAVKLIVLVLGALGIATMWAAVFADVGVLILAILNAIRVLKHKE